MQQEQLDKEVVKQNRKRKLQGHVVPRAATANTFHEKRLKTIATKGGEWTQCVRLDQVRFGVFERCCCFIWCLIAE
jgi:hypothetical protein